MSAQHFELAEFRQWGDQMSARQVTLLDVLRFRLGRPVIISPHPDALGRNMGLESESAHNVDRWGKVLATDAFIPGVHYREQAESVIDEARAIGFTGIGLYTDTQYGGKKMPMFHFDCRPTRKMGAPATWGRVSRKYVSINQALQSLPLGGKS